MKKASLLCLTLLSLLIAGCSEKKSEKSSNTSSSSNNLCEGGSYYTSPGCGGYCLANPTASGCSGVTGGTSGGGSTASCNPPAANQQSVCANFCLYYPQANGCVNGVNCVYSPTASGCGGSSTPVNPNWGVHYPGGVPSGTCSPTYSVGSSSLYETRKGTVTIVGGSWYNPSASEASNYLNTSSLLKSVSGSKTFFLTDSLLKIRFKVKPQPDAAQSSTMCYGRNMPASTIPGYTKLQFSVKLVGQRADNSWGEEPLGSFVVGVNSCSDGIDLSGYKSMYAKGVYVVVSDVKANQNCWWDSSTGFTSCNAFKSVRTFDCWQMDFEVAADGTKSFD